MNFQIGKVQQNFLSLKKLDWNFKSNLDYIFDLCRKTSRVITSCENSIQLKGAENYINNLERYFTHFKKTRMQQQFADKQIAEFRKMLNLKSKMVSADFD